MRATPSIYLKKIKHDTCKCLSTQLKCNNNFTCPNKITELPDGPEDFILDTSLSELYETPKWSSRLRNLQSAPLKKTRKKHINTG
jgi:hypothetical protein